MPYGNQRLVRGDIPRGGFLGSIVKVVGGAVGGFIKGGPIGGITGAIGGTASAVRGNIQEKGGLAAQPIASVPTNQLPEELVRQHQVNVHRKQAQQAAGGPAGLPGVPAQRRLGAGGAGGKRRRMQVTNTRALRRAIRRAQGFAKIAMKTIKIVNPQKKGRFGGFKKRSKR